MKNTKTMNIIINKLENFKGEKFLRVRKENQDLVNMYLAGVKKRSDGSYYINKSVLKSFFSFIDKPIKEINMIDVINYFENDLDTRRRVMKDGSLGDFIKVDSKESHRSRLKSFFSFVIRVFLDQGTVYHNPIPDKSIYQFTEREGDIKKQSEIKRKRLTKEQLLLILDYCKKNRKNRDFIFIGLICCTGARVSEIRTIRINDIIFDQRYFETGFEKNAKKTTLKSKESLLFFFTERFGVYLKNYVLALRSLNPKQIYLFKGYNDTPLSANAIKYVFMALREKTGIDFTSHYFRHTIISERLSSGTPLWVSEGLTNHKINNSTQLKKYAQFTIKEKLEQYDKHFPYYDLPYF